MAPPLTVQNLGVFRPFLRTSEFAIRREHVLPPYSGGPLKAAGIQPPSELAIAGSTLHIHAAAASRIQSFGRVDRARSASQHFRLENSPFIDMRSILLAILITAMGARIAVAGEFEVGLKAYQSGNFAEAARSLGTAATAGDARAQAALGLMYDQGKGVPRDVAKAIQLFRKSASQGHKIGQYSLGVAYARGRGVPVDLAQARSWYELAAAQGLGGAQMNLGAM